MRNVRVGLRGAHRGVRYAHVHEETLSVVEDKHA